jgi:hypothetical protein
MGRAVRTLRRHPGWSAAVAALLAWLVLAVLTWLWLDPDRPLRGIEAALGRGEAVALVGPAGPPRWSRWLWGEEASKVQAPAGGPLTLHSWTRGMLELVPDPGAEHYLLRARVRQEPDGRGSGAQIGVYFAHRTCANSGDVVRLFGQLTFDDQPDLNVELLIAKGAIARGVVPDRCRRNTASLTTRLLAARQGQIGLSHCCSELHSQPFSCSGPGQAPWHKLAVEVCPKGVRGFWDGEDMGLLPRAAFADCARQWEHVRARDSPGGPPAGGAEPRFAPRGSLGLYVERGSASFADVVLEPLRGSD